MALYDFDNLEGRPETQANYQSFLLGGSATYGQYEYGSGLRQKGNTLFDTAYQSDTNSIWGLASKFRPVNLTASLKMRSNRSGFWQF